METLEKTKLQNSKAVDVALSHIEAWSNHNWEKAQEALAADVAVFTTTTQPIMNDVNTVGTEAYMFGLKQFAQAVVPGSAIILASTGDDRNAMVMVTVKADFGQGTILACGSRLYALDEDGRIASEKVIFFVMQ